jgi:hypothetical protein
MKVGHILTEEDRQLNEAEWEKFKEAGFLSLPIYDRNRMRVDLNFGDETWSACDLVSTNLEESEYHSIPLPQEWKERGVSDVWVTFEGHKSIIHVLIEGRIKPLVCTKHYN